MMKVEVKLYSYHDMDLVGLYKTGKVSFPETTRQVLNSYARGEVYKVKLLHTNDKRLAKYPKTSFRKYYHYHVVLDGKEDSDAISLLHKITPGYRNNFIKVVLRQYLCGVFLEEYCVNGDTSFFNEMSRKFQGGRDEKEIRQTKKERDKCTQTELKSPDVTTRTLIESGNESDFVGELSIESGNESGRAGELTKTASRGAKLKEKQKKGITDDTVDTDERSLWDNVKDENESRYVELPTEKHEAEPADIVKNTEHKALINDKAKSIELGSKDNNNKIKEDSFELSNNKTMTTAHTDAHPNIANSVQSYSDEDDFDEFLDEMTEQY
ncbi:hypothetical protein G7B22_24775 [Blautia sp. MSK.20.9]|uniref:hypothetical protein n=1 Tax=Blautia sp. MSK20_18 TaxID=2883186 RepID=UPI00156E12A5|nr:hypothetical protein [Blautia sp. MSK20_18]MCB7508370.1 hypothetical protein [Blautia sp. MSK20_18]NSK11625.1 hypothetical protein [Blautia sp. MSK.20.9]